MMSVYGVLCVLGTVLPLSQFIPWIVEHGLNLSAFVSEAGATRIGAFAWLDVAVSAAVLTVFIS